MIKINGVTIPIPAEYDVGIMDLSKAERNANGMMIIERIATKRKLELKYEYLNKEQLSSLLTRISSVFFQVEYIDPQLNRRRTGTFYVGDRNMGVLDYRNGNTRYKGVSFNFVER